MNRVPTTGPRMVAAASLLWLAACALGKDLIDLPSHMRGRFRRGDPEVEHALGARRIFRVFAQRMAGEGEPTAVGDHHVTTLEFPLPGDYALIRAWKADTAGNLVFRLTQRNFNPLMAMAATVTIVEVENDILEAGELDPDIIHVPGIYVDRLVRIPEDGIWI